MTYSFDVDFDEVRGLAVHCERHVNLAAPRKTSEKWQVHLIQSVQAFRPPGQDRRVVATDPGDDPRRVASEAYARAKHDQEQPVGVRPEVDWPRNKLVLRLVELRDWFEGL